MLLKLFYAFYKVVVDFVRGNALNASVSIISKDPSFCIFNSLIALFF